MAATSTSLPARLGTTLQRAQRINPRLNAFTQLSSQSDLETQYARVDKGKGRLDGKSVGVKDMFATSGDGSRTTCSSRMLQDYKSPFEATVVRQLRQEGAIVMGKTNMDEFGMGSANFHSHFGPTLNPSGPQDIDGTLGMGESEQRVAGGSSGGSAAAVAADLCDFALATDTGGSTRLPASYCGVLGFKPSYGLLSRFGVVAYASSLDTVGLMSKDVTILRDIFDILDQHDPRDPTSIPTFARERASTVHSDLEKRIGEALNSSEKPLSGIRIGVPADLFPTSLLDPSLLPSIRSALSRLKDLGATLHSVRLKTAPLGLSAYYVLASAEASSNLARYDGTEYGFRAPEDSSEDVRTPLYAKTRTLGFGDEVKKRLLLGTFALSAEAFDNYYLQAQRVRKMIQNELDSLFTSSNPLRQSSSISKGAETVDFIVHPTTISPAPLLSSFTSPPSPRDSSPTSTSSSYVQDLLSLPASLAGLPAISIPVGRTQGGDAEGWPVGMTLMSQWGNDRNVLDVAKIVDHALRKC
ncbi:glutamyl-tRNA(Gln) amidotransferase subunit HER2 [Sporobolomyces salmoneus]|uniref:glutamyl-tRNA(Gln) amidotransferase subunit HER2 n=1 Tax=Sporobolomyces salmoneus TaxID=183962 RepID=UPI00317BEC1A